MSYPIMNKELRKQWSEAQKWELAWWQNNPQMHAAEIAKSQFIAGLLGIHNMRGKRVLDVGCGPLSLLLRVPTRGSVALDPLDFGPGLEARYKAAGIERAICKGEEYKGTDFDEAWIYNCLQHTEDPAKVVAMAANAAKRVRVFEWINIPPYQGHLHMITITLVSAALRASGKSPIMESTGTLADHSENHLVGEFYTCIYE
jgi:SAM-dependent methyltransferase